MLPAGSSSAATAFRFNGRPAKFMPTQPQKRSRSNRNFADLRFEAALLQKIESEHLDDLRSIHAKAKIRIWSLAEFIEAPMEALQTVIDEISVAGGRRLSEAPRIVDLSGFGQFLQNLKNQGMHPYLMGDSPVDPAPQNARPKARKPYLVR